MGSVEHRPESEAEPDGATERASEPVPVTESVVESGAESGDDDGERAGDDDRAGETADNSVQDADDPDEGSSTPDPLRFNNWMKRSATGAVMTGIAVGLQQALQLPRQEPAFVIEASGEPHDPNRAIDLHFDPDNPADTVAIIRRPAPTNAPEESSPPA